MPISIGDKVSKRRKELKISQKELAHDICTQSQISRIEKNEIMPGSETLFLISQRLKVSMDYFFGTEVISHEIRGKKLCEDYLELRDYETLNVFVTAQLSTTVSEYEYKYYSWVKAVCTFYISNEDQAIKELNELLNYKLDVPDHVLEASIYNSLGIFYGNRSDHENSLSCFMKAMYIIKEHNIKTQLNSKVLYGLARYYFSREDYDKCYDYAREGLTTCIDYDIVFAIEYLTYLICASKEAKNSVTEDDIELYHMGLKIAELKNNVELVKLYKEDLVLFKNNKIGGITE